MVNGRARIWIQVVWFQSLGPEHYSMLPLYREELHKMGASYHLNIYTRSKEDSKNHGNLEKKIVETEWDKTDFLESYKNMKKEANLHILLNRFLRAINVIFLTLTPIATIRCLGNWELSKQYRHFSISAARLRCSAIAFFLWFSSSSPKHSLSAALETNMSSRV